MSQCPTYFGRKNKMGNSVDMLNYFKDKTVPKGSAKKKDHPELIELGIFIEEERPEFCEENEKIIRKSMEIHVSDGKA